MFEGTRNSLLVGMALLAGLASAPTVWAQGPTAGQNVNMVSGTKWPGGDPFLQRQNEPSIAVSTRNPQHLLAGANDYRTVDLNLVDQLPINQLSGDAWVGVFKSFDGGQRWQSTLLPGFPQDRSSFGANSPMKGFGAASDPVVRAGTNGMFYYSSIALDRSTNLGGLFLSRFIDLNNKENGDAAQSNYPSPTTDPIRYIGTVEVDSGNAGQFIDKPWIATDIPRTGAGTCTMQVPQDNGTTVTQSFPAGNVYMAYAMFVGGTINVRSKINFTKSSDCGQTWTKPIIISQTYDLSQGTQVAVDPETGYVYVAWRVFSGSGNDPDAMVVAKSADGGNNFTKAVSVRSLMPFNPAAPTASASFDQNTSGTEFRTQSMPTIAVDDSGSAGTPGNVYVAWSERGVPPTGDARIMISTSHDGATWSAPMPVDNNPVTDDVGDQFTRGHQLMPAMTFTGGKLMLIYYDLRLDHTTGRFTPNTPFGPDNKGQFFEESRPYLGDDPTKVFSPFVDDAGLAVRRHTIDVNVAQSSGGPIPSFTTARLSRYDFGQPGPDPSVLQLQQLEQLKVNPPNLPMFSQGTVPFMGDYLDVAGLMFVPLTGGGWTFNNPPPPTVPSSSAASKPAFGSPVYYGSWTSNQDVIPPADGNWTKYFAIPLPSQTASIFNGQPLPPCAAGWEGDRNQNIYESRITQGLLVSSPQNSKPLSTTLQRSFVILIQNSTNFQKTFQVSIANQPPGNFTITGQNSPGGFASFQQAVPNQPSLPNPLPAPVTSEFAAIPAHSGAPQTVFALSSNPTASITVNVNEVDSTGKVISGGLSSFIVLNADGTVPPLTNPDGAPTGTSIAGVEIYDPNITAPNITAPNITAPNITAPNITAPNITAPNITAPNITAPNITAPNITATSATNPNITAPNITAGSIADATYTVTNSGNTTVEYHVKLAGGASGAHAKVPLQLTVNQIYTTPTSYQCQLIPQQQNITYVNVVNPEFTPLNQLSNPNITAADPSEATIYLAPGDSALITLRGQTDVATMQSIVTEIAPVVVPHAVNTNSVATTPTFTAPPFITTTSLPNGVSGVPFSATLQAIGGTAPYTWGVRFGTLPSGLNLNPSTGLISGTPTVSNLPGTSVTFQAQDSTGLVVTRNLTIAVAPSPLVFTAATVPTAVVGRPYIHTLPLAGGTQPYNATVTSGTPPPGLIVVGNVVTGTPSGTGIFTFTVTVTDSSTPTQTATQTLTIAVNTLVITSAVLPNGIVGVPYNATISAAGGTLPLSFSFANTAFPPGLLIQQPGPGSTSGALAGTPTQAGTFTFSESVADSSNPQKTAIQNYVVTIAPAGSPVPAGINFVTQPQNSVGGQTLSGVPIIVQVSDAANNPIPATTVVLTLSGIFSAPVPCSVATLTGTLAAVTDNTGRATFSDLSVDRGAFNYALLASTGSASQSSAGFSVQGFCASGNLSTQREGHTQDVLGTSNMRKFSLDPAGSYLLANTNPGPGGIPDNPHPPLIISLAQFGVKPGDVISGFPVGDADVCGVGQFCSGELFTPFTCAVFSSSNTLLPPGGTINRIPGAITPDFTTAFPCNTGNTAFGNLPTDIPQDFALSGERVTVPPGAQYLFVALADIFYADNLDQNGDYGVAFTLNSTNSVNGKVLIAGGADNNGNALNTAELFDPVLGFTQPTGNLTDPNGRANHVSVVLPNGKVLLIGGVSNVNFVATAELYDPATGTFTPTGSMSEPRGLPAVAMLADGRVLVSGGFNSPLASNTAEIYDPATGVFTPTGNMTQRRARHQMTLLPNGKVLVTGGRDTQQNFFALANAEIFDPFANQGVGAFTAIGNMNSPRFKHTATLLSNGTVLIAGGFNGGDTSPSVASAEIFDPKTNVFTPTGSMNTPRARHTSTLLPDGTVLEAGSINGFNGVIAAAPAELYSPISGTFSLTGSMITGREFPVATLLPPNGNVLVSGGDDGVNVLASTEIYYNAVAQTPVVITTTSVPNGIISQPYVQLLLEQNRSGPITWSLASGTLPPGITLSANGILSGTPTSVGSFTFTVQVTDGMSTTTATFTINVSLAALVFTSNTMPAAGAGRPYSQPLPVTGGTQPYSVTVTSGTLPPGLALSSTGILSGTPSGVGSFTFTATVTDSSTTKQTATQTLTIAVDTLFITTTALPSGIVGVPYNAAMTTVGGTLPLSFSAATAAFPPGLAIQQPAANSHSGALAGIPTLAGHYTFSESVVDSSAPAQTATQYYVMDIAAAGTTAVPATVTFLSQPQNSTGGQILTGSPIRVHVTDANNAPIIGASVAISFNGAPPCSSAVLSGTLNGITNGAGNAVFLNLSIDRGQLGYTLLASAGSASAVSAPFTVNGFCSVTTSAYVGPFAATTLLSNGKALITGGVDASGSDTAVAQLYDPTTQTFTPTGSMQLARREHTSTLLADGRVLIAGGRGGTAIFSATTATAEIYDPVAGTFTSTASPMNAPRRLHTATVLADGTVLLAAGLGTGTVQNTAEIFDPKTGSFTLLTATLATARETHTATLLPDGTVLLAGGSSGGATLSSAEIYNPSTRSFVAVAAPMNSPRSVFNTLLLPTGKALLVGGISDSAGTIATATAELYNPLNGTFTSTGSMSSGRAYFTANLLPNGQVLMAGGLPTNTASSIELATAEVYDPATGKFSQTGSLSASRAQQTAVTLNDGTVLVVGSSDEVYYSTAPLAALQITTPSPLPAASFGKPYTQVLLEQGGVGTLTWGLVGGAVTLPPGILLTQNGILHGTPTTVGTATFTATVTDSSTPPQTVSQNFTLVVGSPLQFTTTQLPTALSGVAYNHRLPVTGGVPPYFYSLLASPLPSGLTFNPTTGVISGTTTQLGTFQIVDTVLDSSVPQQSVAQVLTLVVASPLAISTTNLPGGAVGSSYNASVLTNGGSGTITESVTAGSLPTGLVLSSAGLLTGTPTVANAFTFTITAADQSFPPQTVTQIYTVTIITAGTPPTLVSVSPNTGYQGQQNLSVTITGQSTHFAQGTTIADFGNGVHVQSLTVGSPTTATAVLNIDAVPNAGIQLNFFPNSVFNANTAAMDVTLGTTGYTIDSFETTGLIPGLTIQLSGGVPTTTWTSLPNLFDGDVCPGLASGEAWDGTDTASNQIANQVTNCNGTTGTANLITFNYAPGATSFGIGLSNFQSVNPPSPQFPITNHELFVNGVDIGALETLAGAAWSPGLTRNAYLRIDGANGGVITSVGFENLSAADFLMFDHLAVLPSATAARNVTLTTNSEVATLTNGFTVNTNPPVVVVSCPGSVNLTLCGRYSMGVVGFSSSGGPVAGGVTFVADNAGHIVSGIRKFNQSVAGPTTSTIIGGSYVMDSSGDGRGVLTLIDSTASSTTYRFVLESLANAGVAQVEEFDSSGTFASGIIAGPETPPIPQISPNTTVALNVEGINGSGQLAALLGEFQVGSNGCDGTVGSFNSLAGEPIVTNTAGTVHTALAATGSCTASDPNTGLGTAQITISGGTPFTNSTLNFVYVAVGSGTALQGVFFLEVDPIAANQPILSGLAGGVAVPAGGFNASSLGCPCLLVRSGTTDGTTTTGHSVGSIVRILTTPGIGASGTLTGVLDQNAGGTITLAGVWPYTSYTVDSNGVGTITGTGSPLHFIITGGGSGGDFTMQTLDESVSVLTGSFRAQNATTIQSSGAPYIVGLGNGDFVGVNRNVKSAVGLITPSGATSGTLAGTVDLISNAGSVVGAAASGTYTIDSTSGRGTGTANLTGGTSSISIVIYARRVRQFVVLDMQSSDPYQFGARLQ